VSKSGLSCVCASLQALEAAEVGAERHVTGVCRQVDRVGDFVAATLVLCCTPYAWTSGSTWACRFVDPVDRAVVSALSHLFADRTILPSFWHSSGFAAQFPCNAVRVPAARSFQYFPTLSDGSSRLLTFLRCKTQSRDRFPASLI